MNKNITAEQVATHYARTGSLEQTASDLHMTRSRARRMLESTGAWNPPRVDFTAFKEAGVIELYKGGRSQQSLARQFGCSQSSIWRFLRDHDALKASRKRDYRGAKHHSWNGGITRDRHGYLKVAVEEGHRFACMADKNGRVMQHRLVMAEHLGRPLKRSETVHHKNGKRDDNRIDNLQLRQGKHGTGVVCRCADCGSTNIITDDLD